MNKSGHNNYPIKRIITGAAVSLLAVTALEGCNGSKPVAVTVKQAANLDQAAKDTLADGINLYTKNASKSAYCNLDTSSSDICDTYADSNSLNYSDNFSYGKKDKFSSITDLTITEAVGPKGLDLNMEYSYYDATGDGVDDVVKLVDTGLEQRTSITPGLIMSVITSPDTHFVSVSTNGSNGPVTCNESGSRLSIGYGDDYGGNTASRSGTAQFVADQLSSVSSDINA